MSTNESNEVAISYGQETRSPLGIKEVLAQKPFEVPAVQSFFKDWFARNDSIAPVFVDRTAWQEKEAAGILKTRTDGKKSLFIPRDLQLWEMVGVMEVVEHDTFDTRPERQGAKAEEQKQQGKLLRNAGIYLASRLDKIPQGKEIALALAEEFYGYGDALMTGRRADEQKGAVAIASEPLTPEEIAAVDRFLAGDQLYAKRILRVERAAAHAPDERDEIYEAEREKTLAQFFSRAEKMVALQEQHGERDETKPSVRADLKPWESDAPFYTEFIQKIEHNIAKAVELPKFELTSSALRRGMDLLAKYYPGAPKGFDNEDKTLREVIDIDQKKQLFSDLRAGTMSDFYLDHSPLVQRITDLQSYVQGDAARVDQINSVVRDAVKTNNFDSLFQLGYIPADAIDALRRDFSRNALLAQEERRVIDELQDSLAIFMFWHTGNAHNPSEIIPNRTINCVSASMIGGALLAELGINYLVASVPGHSILVLPTSDGKLQWSDLLGRSSNIDITDANMEGKTRDGKQLTLQDILAYAKNPYPEGIRFTMTDEGYKERLPIFKEWESQYIGLFPPELGEKMQVLNNIAIDLLEDGRNAEGLEAAKQAVALDPFDATTYNTLGVAYREMLMPNEAIDAYRKAIAIEPTYDSSYNGLGQVLLRLGRQEEATSAFEQCLRINENNIQSLNNLSNIFLNTAGRQQEAAPLIRRFIALVDKDTEADAIANAEHILAQITASEEAPLSADITDTRVEHAYRDILGRDPDPEGREIYEGQLRTGTSLARIRQELMTSGEFREGLEKRAGIGDRAGAIEVAYRRVLGREIDDDGRRVYVDGGRPIEFVIDDLVRSGEFRDGQREIIRGELDALYQEVLKREGDEGGIEHYSNQVEQGRSLREIQEEMTNSQEFKEKFGKT